MIKSGAFDGCKGLKEVIGAEKVTTIEALAFHRCVSLESIELSNVKVIGREAFFGCSLLKNMDLKSAIEIGDYAFWLSGLEEANHFSPEQIQKFGRGVFTGTPFLDSYWGTNPIIVGSVLVDGSHCTGSIAIPEGVTEIAESAFASAKITSVTMPKTLQKIGTEAFFRCQKLKTIAMKDSVTTLGKNVFYGCTGLMQIRLSNRIETLPEDTFCECKSLISITMPADWEPNKKSPLATTLGLKSITLPTDTKNLPNYALSMHYVDETGKKYMSAGAKENLKPVYPTLYTTEIKKTSELYKYAKANGFTLKALALTKTELKLKAGEKESLCLNSGAKATWKSSNKSVATVGSTGTVYAKKSGTTTITATIYGKAYRCKVTVESILK